MKKGYNSISLTSRDVSGEVAPEAEVSANIVFSW